MSYPIPQFIFVNIPNFPVTEWPDKVIAIFKALLFVVGWWQLRSIRKTGYADFAHRLNADFFTPDCARIIRLIRDTSLRFTPLQSVPTFTGDDARLDSLDLDQNVLGPLEAVGIFEKRHLLDIEFVYDMFGSSFIEVFTSEAVQQYIDWTRKQPNSGDVYDCIIYLHRECLSFEAAKARGRAARTWWKFVYKFRSRLTAR